jgi:hypothetical protein
MKEESLPASNLECLLVRCFVQEVKLGVEADGPLIQQGHVISALLRGEAIHQTAKSFKVNKSAASTTVQDFRQ